MHLNKFHTQERHQHIIILDVRIHACTCISIHAPIDEPFRRLADKVKDNMSICETYH